MVTGYTQQGVSRPEKQRLIAMPSRLHGISLGWLLTVKASQFSEKFNPISLGFADHTNFAPATIYALARSTGQLARFIIFGSFVTAKREPNDVDIFMLMEDAFDAQQLQ
jgi:hypothetical protein